MKMPGHMGNKRATVQSLEVIQVRDAENLLLIKGSVPGPTGAVVIVRTSKKHGTEKKKAPQVPAGKAKADAAKKAAAPKAAKK